MNALEKRIGKLEKAAGGFPCKKPGHRAFFLFVMRYGEKELNAEAQAKIDSIRACPKCKDKLVIVLKSWGIDPTEAPKVISEGEPKSFDLTYGKEAPDIKINFAEWLKPEDLN